MQVDVADVTICLSTSDAIVLLWSHNQPMIVSTTIGLDGDGLLVDIETEYKSIKGRRTQVCLNEMTCFCVRKGHNLDYKVENGRV